MGYFTLIFTELKLLDIWIRILMCHANFSKHALIYESFKDTEDMRAAFLWRGILAYSCFSWEKGPIQFLNADSFIREVHSVKGPNRIVYQRCLDVAMSWIGPGSTALITLEWLVLVKVSVRSDQCLCWGLWLSNGVYPDILHSLCLTHTHTHTYTNIIFRSPAGKPRPYVKTEII